MRKILLLSVLLLANSVFANELVFEQSGFSIEALDAAPVAEGMQPIQMFLPQVDGFAGNVNVQIQPYSESLAAYKALSDAQFTEFGLEVIRSDMKSKELVFEYRGVMREHALRFYAKAIKKGDYIYLATATDLQSQWPKTGQQLIDTVNSLQLTQ